MRQMVRYCVPNSTISLFSVWLAKNRWELEDAHQGKYKITDEGLKYAVDGGEVGLFLAFFPKGAGEQCIDTDTGYRMKLQSSGSE